MTDRIWKLRLLCSLLRETFEGWHRDVWKRDLDERYCCDGRECGCYGATIRELWSDYK